MAAGLGELAYNIKLEYSAAGSVYTELEDLDELGEPGSPDAPDVDITPLRISTPDRVFRRGLFNNGEFTFSQFYEKTRMTALNTIKDAGTAYYWKVTLPDDSTFVFRGRLKKAAIKGVADPDDPLVIMCAVKVTGAITFTAAS